MKNIAKSIIYLNLIFSPIFADENASIIMEQEKIKNLQNEKSLEHLFNNSKFPVDDYIYKAGKKEPNQDLKEILEKLEN